MTCVCTSVVISMQEFHCKGGYNKMCAKLMTWRIFLPFFPLQLRRHLPGVNEVKSLYEIIRICFFSCLYDTSRNMTRHTHTHTRTQSSLRTESVFGAWCYGYETEVWREALFCSLLKLLFDIVKPLIKTGTSSSPITPEDVVSFLMMKWGRLMWTSTPLLLCEMLPLGIRWAVSLSWQG